MDIADKGIPMTCHPAGNVNESVSHWVGQRTPLSESVRKTVTYKDTNKNKIEIQNGK